MSKEQIEEIAKTLCRHYNTRHCEVCDHHGRCMVRLDAECIYNAGYRKQRDGEWEWFEEWNPSTPEHPRECDDCGWRCGECKTALADIVGGYWDDPDEKPNLNFCPNCGVKMSKGV